MISGLWLSDVKMLYRAISKIKCRLGLHSWAGDIWGIAVCKSCNAITQYKGWGGKHRKFAQDEDGMYVLSDERARELYNDFGVIV